MSAIHPQGFRSCSAVGQTAANVSPNEQASRSREFTATVAINRIEPRSVVSGQWSVVSGQKAVCLTLPSDFCPLTSSPCPSELGLPIIGIGKNRTRGGFEDVRNVGLAVASKERSEPSCRRNHSGADRTSVPLRPKN